FLPLQLACVLHGVTMDHLRADNDQLAQQVSLLATQAVQMQAVWPHHKCPVTVLDKFDVLLAQFSAFWVQFQFYMSLQPEDFRTNWDKVEFLISLLLGSAENWAMPNQLLDNYADSNGRDDGWRPHPLPSR
uniref:DUF4939 domain-containing protein n=1 Tax=Laticauda laticaudata TaxID=8630 RepID=A0A8C5SEA4_LATLA